MPSPFTIYADALHASEVLRSASADAVRAEKHTQTYSRVQARYLRLEFSRRGERERQARFRDARKRAA